MAYELFTRRMYLVAKASVLVSRPLAVEKVAVMIADHPEWNMRELKTWRAWERALM